MFQGRYKPRQWGYSNEQDGFTAPPLTGLRVMEEKQI